MVCMWYRLPFCGAAAPLTSCLLMTTPALTFYGTITEKHPAMLTICSTVHLTQRTSSDN